MKPTAAKALTIPMVANSTKVDNLPRQEGLCFLYDPAEGEEWIDMGNEFMDDNGGSNYYAYFSTKALCENASLEEGETERISALEINPDTYFALMDSDSEEAETEQIQEDEIQEEQRQEETEESSYVLDGHILRTRERATLGKGAAAGELDDLPSGIL